MIDGVEIFSFKIDITVESSNSISTTVYYDTWWPVSTDHTNVIKSWSSIGQHDASENPKYSYLHVEIAFFIPEFKDFSESGNIRSWDFSTLFARVRVMSTFRQDISTRTSESPGAMFHVGKV
jgi:hypothetical protein